MNSDPVVELSDDELRQRGSAKWAAAPPDVLPAWVAEMDFALSAVIAGALHEAVERGAVGYSPPDRLCGVAEVLAGFGRERWAWEVDPERVVLATDTMTGVEVVLRTLCDEAPVVVPTPAYPPFLGVVPLTAREMIPVPLSPDAGTATLDLETIGTALAAGARTVLLCQPHNPWGRVFSRTELEGLRDVVDHHGARVLSDEVHAPLVLRGASHLPYAAVDGAAQHTTTLTSPAKGWNMPGVKCAQIVVGNDADREALRALPLVANHGPSPLGVAAARAAYERGGSWLDAVVERLSDNRDRFAALVAERLPAARLRPVEATYLAWLDVRAYGHANPAQAALKRGQVLVNDGASFGPGGAGHVRVNLATSADRVEQTVRRLAEAFEG